MGVSKDNGTPKSSTLIGFSIINRPFWGRPIFGNHHIPTLQHGPFHPRHAALSRSPPPYAAAPVVVGLLQRPPNEPMDDAGLGWWEGSSRSTPYVGDKLIPPLRGYRSTFSITLYSGGIYTFL